MPQDFRHQLNLPHLQKFARRGQNQFGVDLISEADGRVVGIQCKSKITERGFDKDEVEEIVNLAKTFAPALDELIIATSAERDPSVQQDVIRINRDRGGSGLFCVEIYFWGDIEEILNASPELALGFYGPSPGILQWHPVTGSIGTASPAQSLVRAEIDAAMQHVNAGRVETGSVLLKNLRQERWGQLSGWEKFSLLANQGHILLQEADELGAARLYLEAASYWPEDIEALGLEAYGYLLLGETDKAYRIAHDACQKNPANERVQSIRVQSAPAEISYEQLTQSIPAALQETPGVAVPLSERLRKEGNLDDAERVLRQAKEKTAEVQFNLGALLLEQALPSSIQDAVFLISKDPGKAREACELFEAVLARPKISSSLAAASLHNKGKALALLGEAEQAFAASKAAFEKEPFGQIGVSFVVEALRSGKVDEALEAARIIFKHKPAAHERLLLGAALLDSEGDNSRTDALNLLMEGLNEVNSLSPDLRIEYAIKTIHLLYSAGLLTTDAGKIVLSALPESIEKAIIESWLLIRANDDERARELATQAAAMLQADSPFSYKRETAVLLHRLGLESLSLPIWLEVSPPRGYDQDTLRVIHILKSLGKDSEILDYCEQLRGNGVLAPEVGEAEVSLLLQYNELRAAQAVLRQYLAANSQNLRFRLFMVHAAAAQGWRDLVEEYIVPCPSMEEIWTAEEGAAYAEILRFLGRTIEAVEVAYELVRRFPDDANSHRVLIASILLPPKGDLNFEAPSQVISGCAIRIRREHQESSNWIVIEESSPQVSRDEYPPDHPLSRALIGKKVGDQVELPESRLRVTKARVEEIKNKILYRMHQSLELMNQRFPEQSFFEKIPIKITDEESRTGHELDELIEVNRRLAQGPAEAERFYEQRQVPLQTLAQIVGRSIPEVLVSLAFSENRTVYCVKGTGEDFQRVSKVLQAANVVVLDLTALGTISLLEQDFDLSRIAAKCVVSEGSLECLRKLGKPRDDERPSGYMRYEDGGLIYTRIDIEVEQAIADRAAKFADTIDNLCEVVGGRSLARLGPEKRRELINFLGVEVAESVALAIEFDCPLWSDDYVTGTLGEEEFGFKRVWTQAMCFWLRDAGSMSQRECDLVSARLCGYGYQFTSISPNVVMAACRASDWNPDKRPLRQTIDAMFEGGDDQRVLLATASLISLTYREAPILEQADLLTIRILDRLAHHTHGLATIRKVYAALGSIFGVNVIGAARAATVIEAWLKTTIGGGVIEI